MLLDDVIGPDTHDALELAAKLKSPGRGRLPEFKNLRKKTPEELIKTLDRFGLKPNVKEFSRRARRVYESQLEKLIDSKGRPDRETWRAINEQIEKAAIDVLGQQTKDAIHQYRKARIRPLAKHFVWIAVMDKGTCKSCDDRHGKRKTMKQWERYGEPGSPVLVCQNRCRCVLQPDIVTGDTPAEVKEAIAGEAEGLTE